MKELLKILLIMLITLAVSVGALYIIGWSKVYSIETIGKATANANRKVYEESNSFTKGKKQEILKAYKEWQKVETEEERRAIEDILSMSLADFDEDKFITDPKLLSWVKRVKY